MEIEGEGERVQIFWVDRRRAAEKEGKSLGLEIFLKMLELSSLGTGKGGGAVSENGTGVC